MKRHKTTKKTLNDSQRSMNDIKKTTDTSWPQTVKMPKYTRDQTGTENNHKIIKMGHNMSTKRHETATKGHKETKQPEAVALHACVMFFLILQNHGIKGKETELSNLFL